MSGVAAHHVFVICVRCLPVRIPPCTGKQRTQIHDMLPHHS